MTNKELKTVLELGLYTTDELERMKVIINDETEKRKQAEKEKQTTKQTVYKDAKVMVSNTEYNLSELQSISIHENYFTSTKRREFVVMIQSLKSNTITLTAPVFSNHVDKLWENLSDEEKAKIHTTNREHLIID